MTSQHCSGFRAQVFPHFSEKKELFDAGYPLLWYLLKQLSTLVSMKSARYLPRRFAARQISSTIHLDFLKRPSLLISGSGGRPARKDHFGE